MTIQEKFKFLRETARLTVAQLAEQSGVECSTILAIEDGAKQVVSLKALLRLTKALGVTVDQLLVDVTDDDLAVCVATPENPTFRKVQALQMLSDEIYAVLRDVSVVKWVAGNLLEEYFSGGYGDTAAWRETLAVNFDRAQMLANVLLDYSCKVYDMLNDLDTVATVRGEQDIGGLLDAYKSASIPERAAFRVFSPGIPDHVCGFGLSEI